MLEKKSMVKTDKDTKAILTVAIPGEIDETNEVGAFLMAGLLEEKEGEVSIRIQAMGSVREYAMLVNSLMNSGKEAYGEHFVHEMVKVILVESLAQGVPSIQLPDTLFEGGEMAEMLKCWNKIVREGRESKAQTSDDQKPAQPEYPKDSQGCCP